MRVFHLFCLVSWLASGLGCSAYEQCTVPSAGDLAALPAQLSESGLYRPGTTELAPGVRPYTPAFELWSDGAVKRRWIWLPPGTVIDTSDLDDWRFPSGTKLWKEFTRDGVRVETRLLRKTGDGEGDWVGAAYLWSGDDAELTPAGADNALGTEHDVPAAERCFGCHGGRRSRVLGFSAVQLGNSSGPLTLSDAVAAGLLSAPPTGALKLPGTAMDQQVLGMLHANCAHCHNQRRPERLGPRCYDPENDIDLALTAAMLGDFAQTGLSRTVIGQSVKPGNADGSKLFKLYSHRGPAAPWGPTQMPPLATETVDAAGAALLKTWIDALP